jgi:hypothetical protein
MAAPVFVTNDVPSADQVNEWMVNIHFVRKTATETVSSTTTLQNDDDLFLSVAASAIYEVRMMLKIASQATDDLKVGFTGPAGYSFDWIGLGGDPALSGFANDQTGLFTTGATPIFAGMGGTNAPLMILGLLVVSSTAGTFQLQWAQGTLGASGTSLLANSYMRLERVS